MLETVLLM